MGQLESTMETISGASDSVNSSLSERRAQLEGLNGVKSNLAKLQLLMDLPPRLQALYLPISPYVSLCLPISHGPAPPAAGLRG